MESNKNGYSIGIEWPLTIIILGMVYYFFKKWQVEHVETQVRLAAKIKDIDKRSKMLDLKNALGAFDLFRRTVTQSARIYLDESSISQELTELKQIKIELQQLRDRLSENYDEEIQDRLKKLKCLHNRVAVISEELNEKRTKASESSKIQSASPKPASPKSVFGRVIKK